MGYRRNYKGKRGNRRTWIPQRVRNSAVRSGHEFASYMHSDDPNAHPADIEASGWAAHDQYLQRHDEERRRDYNTNFLVDWIFSSPRKSKRGTVTRFYRKRAWEAFY